jgi:hypothetical protein
MAVPPTSIRQGPFLVDADDQAIPTEAERQFAKRMGTTTVEVAAVSSLTTLPLAFYAGWPRAMSAISLARELFDGGQRGREPLLERGGVRAARHRQQDQLHGGLRVRLRLDRRRRQP